MADEQDEFERRLRRNLVKAQEMSTMLQLKIAKAAASRYVSGRVRDEIRQVANNGGRLRAESRKHSPIQQIATSAYQTIQAIAIAAIEKIQQSH